MTKYTQTKLSSEDGTVHGSCFRTCVGSIMDIDPETIPHWEDMGDAWHNSFFSFLERNGYEFEGTLFKEEKLKEYPGVDGYVIVRGKSPRGFVSRGHAVIYKDGEPFHDPHPSGDFITEFQDAMMIRRHPARKILMEIHEIFDLGDMLSDVLHRAKFLAKRIVDEGADPDEIEVSGEDTVSFEFQSYRGRVHIEVGKSSASYFIERGGEYTAGELKEESDIYNMQSTLIEHLIKNQRISR